MTSRSRDSDPVDRPEPYYTNEGEFWTTFPLHMLITEDVALLHEIVVHAQEILPTLPAHERVPTNALFNAYYAILPTVGIDADHDSRYARVLFKIGGMRGNEGLYAKFEAVLLRMGIEIQFEESEIARKAHEITGLQAYSELHQSLEEHPEAPRASLREGRRRRRDSESSLWHFGMATPSLGKRPRSESLVSRTNNIIPLRLRSDEFDADSRAEQEFRETALDHADRQNGRDVGAWLKTNVTHGFLKSQGLPVVKQHDIRILDESEFVAEQNHGRDFALAVSGKSQTSDESSDLILTEQKQARGQAETCRLPGLLSESMLDMKAALIRQHRSRNTALQIYRFWRQKTLQQQEDNANLEVVAKEWDRRTLIRQAFDSWCTIPGADRYFLIERDELTQRARHYFLLTKAFTHWAEIVSSEVQRTSAARRHILRVRYFNAWRDITAVNELKVRRHVLNKFFGIWQNESSTRTNAINLAVVRYQGNIVRNVFWTWFWSFCERKAPAWWAYKARYRYFSPWLMAGREHREHDRQATEYCRSLSKRRVLKGWQRKANQYAWNQDEAARHMSTLSCTKYLSKWRLETADLSHVRNLQTLGAVRLQRYVLKRWVLQIRQTRQAAGVDHFKIVREAWITWNVKLRCSVLQSRIQERLISQALYKWVLKERTILAQRLIDRRSLQAGMQSMICNSKFSINRELENTRLAHDHASRKLLAYTIARWRAKLDYQQHCKTMAAHIKRPTTISTAFGKWTGQAQHVNQLQNWAIDGCFYFSTSRTLRAWKAATEGLKREKRRNAYAQVRRKNKVALVGKVLRIWQEQARVIIDHHGRVEGVLQNRNVVSGLEIFDRWRARSEEVAELETIRQQTILERSLTTWTARSHNSSQQDKIAANFFEDHLTLGCLRRWSRHALRIRAQEYVVAELRDKHEKRLTRKVVFHWYQRSNIAEPSAPHRNRERGIELPGLENTERAEVWSEFGEEHERDDWIRNFDGMSVSTPLPAYLNTPSKRATRITAFTRLPTTTPSAALSTPAERQLRAQYSGSTLTSFRGARSQSLLLMDPGALTKPTASTYGKHGMGF